jgi:capsular polysaccharide biosynthesis protein
MHLREYVLVIRRRWWMIALATFVAAATAYAIARAQQPTYRSSVRLEVQGRIETAQIPAIDRVLRQMAARVKTTAVAEQVRQRLQLDLNADNLIARLHTQAFADTLHIQIDVDDEDPRRAERIAGGFADVIQERQTAAMASVPADERVSLSLLELPTPARPSNPQTRSLVLGGALLGLLFGIVLVFVLDYLDETFRGPGDVERSLDLPVIGVVYEAKP